MEVKPKPKTLTEDLASHENRTAIYRRLSISPNPAERSFQNLLGENQRSSHFELNCI
jgi:hypothetical protein